MQKLIVLAILLLTGLSAAQTGRIQLVQLSTSGAANGNVVTFNGTNAVWQAPSGGGGGAQLNVANTWTAQQAFTDSSLTDKIVLSSSSGDAFGTISSPASTYAGFGFLTGAARRWLVAKDPNNDFAILRYNSSGVFQDTPFVLDDATGDLALTGNIALAGTSKTITLKGVSSEPPAPTADNVAIYGQKVAGRMVPVFKGPSGLAANLQASLARNKIGYASPSGNATTLTQFGIALATTGTATTANVATTNLHSSLRRLDYLVTTAATTAVAGFRGGGTQFYRGDVAGRGGFYFICRWSHATGAATATMRGFAGMRSSTAAPTDVEPSSLTNMVGMGWDASDSNIQLMTNDGTGVATKTDLGSSFAVPTTDRSTVYEIGLFSPPNGSSISWQVTDLSSNATVSGTLTTDIPAAATLLNPYAYTSVGGTSSVVGITLFSLYIETDN
jgi:hypothetical protein